MQVKVSRYNNVTDVTGRIATLDEVVEAIKSGSVAEKVMNLRKATDTSKIASEKAKLPAVCFSGTFKKGRTDADIITHSGLICLDFDKVADIEGVWAELIEFPYTVLIFVSPSGTGVKAVIHIARDAKLHRRYFSELQKIFPTIDPSGANEARLCFLSYDKDLYFNPLAPQMPIPAEEIQATSPVIATPNQTKQKPRQYNSSSNREEDIVIDIYNYLMSSGHSLTYNYNEWLKIGYALLNTFDYSTAETLFCLLSSIDMDKFDETNCRKTLTGLSKHNTQSRGFGYIVSAATLAGWSNQNEFSKRAANDTPHTVSVKKNNSPQNNEAAFATLPFLYIKKTKTSAYVKIDNYKLLKYVESLGYVKIKFDDGKYRFFKLSDAKIKEVEIADMTSELRETIDALPNIILVSDGEMEINKDELHSSIFDVLADVFTEKKLNYTSALKREFLKDTRENSFFTFENRIVSVTKEEITDFGYDQCSALVWSDNIIAHKIEIENEIPDETKSCEFAQFVWYLCGQDKLRFLQLKTALGYLLRTYRDPSIAVAIILTEEKVVDGVADGGTGKGIFSKALEYLRSVYVVDGKLNKVNSQFAFQRYELKNTIVSYQDGEFDNGFNRFFNIITDGLTVERKNNKEIFLPFKATQKNQFEAPTWLITTNKPIKAEGNAVKRRLHICEVSSYWKDNLPFDFFGHNLFYDWDSAEWNKFYNFMFRCCQDFMIHRLAKAESINKELNNLISLTNKKFVDWFHDFLLQNKMWQTNNINIVGQYYKGKPFSNRYEFYRQIADFCGWGIIDNGNRVEVTQGSVKGSNNQVLRWLEIGCRALGISLNDRAKGELAGKSVSTFEFTIDATTTVKIKDWLLKHCQDAASIMNEKQSSPAVAAFDFGNEEIDDYEDAPF